MTKKLNKGLALLLATILALSLSGALITAFAAPYEYKGYVCNEVYDDVYEYDAYELDELYKDEAYEMIDGGEYILSAFYSFAPFNVGFGNHPDDDIHVHIGPNDTPVFTVVHFTCAYHCDICNELCSNVFRLVASGPPMGSPQLSEFRLYFFNGTYFEQIGNLITNPGTHPYPHVHELAFTAPCGKSYFLTFRQHQHRIIYPHIKNVECGCDTIYIEVEKLWDFPADEDVTLPEGLPIRLIGTTNGEGDPVVRKITLTAPDWSHVFTDLPLYRNGVRVVWTVEEDLPPGWEQINLDIIFDEYGRVVKILLTNSLILIDIEVEKVWNFPAGAEVTLPNLPVRLIGTVDGVDNPVVVREITLTGLNNWLYTFTDLPLYHNSARIDWAVEEDLPPGWAKAPLNIIEEDGIVVRIVLTNNLIIDPEVVRTPREKSVVKVWDDNNNAEGLRPAQLEVHLLRNGAAYRIVFLNAANNWSHEFPNLWMYDENGVDYVYLVTEIVPDGYNPLPSIVYNPNAGVWTITNTLIPQHGNGNGNGNGEPPTGAAPRTGDLASALPFISAFLLSTSSVLGGMSLRKRLNK